MSVVPSIAGGGAMVTGLPMRRVRPEIGPDIHFGAVREDADTRFRDVRRLADHVGAAALDAEHRRRVQNAVECRGLRSSLRRGVRCGGRHGCKECQIQHRKGRCGPGEWARLAEVSIIRP